MVSQIMIGLDIQMQCIMFYLQWTLQDEYLMSDLATKINTDLRYYSFYIRANSR